MPTLDQMLTLLPKRLATTGASAVWEHLNETAQQVRRQKPDAKLTAEKLATRAVDLCKQNDPAGTLALITLLEDRGLGNQKLRALKATCFDRTGDHPSAKAETLAVVEDALDAEAVLVAANLLVRYGEQEKALNAALKAYDDLGRPLRHTATVLYITQRCAAFEASDRLTAQITAAFVDDELATVQESPRTNLLWSSDPKMNIEVTKLWAANNLPTDLGAFNGIRPPLLARRLKIGYLSSDFREHPTLRLMMGALRHHDSIKYEIILICSGWDDQSAIRKEAESLVSKVITVTHLNDRDAAMAIKQEGIDVLVELNGPTRANRMSILSYRPAPVQIDYLGWAGSVGGLGVDYVIGDTWTIPHGAEAIYPERVMRMDPTYQINDHRNFSSVSAAPRGEYGLPENAVVLGVFNAVNKIQGDVWSLWMKLMKDIPNSVMWILDPGNAARRRLGQLAVKNGVAVNRIIGASMMHQDQHLDRIAAADLMLDPWPYGGHTSTTDALYAGVPVITMNGTNFPGRVSAGLLRAAGLPELVCANPKDYYLKVRSLAETPSLLEKYHVALKHATHTTCFDAANRTRQLEALFSHAYKVWTENKPTTHLNVPQLTPIQPRLVPDSPLQVTVNEANTGYASAPNWQRIPRKSPGLIAPHESTPPKRRVVLVAGSWSSGTSATAQVIEALGANLVGDMFNTVDERTDTYEMAEFRKLLLKLANESELRRVANREEAIAAFKRFDEQFLMGVEGPVLLKHPLSALFIDELETVFDTHIVVVMRPFADIEATRKRRGWRAHFGQHGASIIYSLLNDALAKCKSPTLWFKYQDLVNNPYNQVVQVANFIGFGTDSESLERAISRVRRR